MIEQRKQIMVAGVEVTLHSWDGGASWHALAPHLPTKGAMPIPRDPVPGQKTIRYGNEAVICYQHGGQIRKIYPRPAGSKSLKKAYKELQLAQDRRAGHRAVTEVCERVSDRVRRRYE